MRAKKPPFKLQTSRRRFLKQSAAALAWAVGVTGSRAPALTRAAQRPPRQQAPSSTAQEHTVYLPSISGGGKRPRRPSKLGVHTIRPGGAEKFVADVSKAGAHVALVKGLDDLGYLSIVKDVSPATLRVGRVSDPWGGGIQPEGDPVIGAQWKMSYHVNAWEPDRENVDYWEVLNEADPPGVDGHRWLAEFYIACMEIADQHGYKLAVFSYSVGVPEWEEWEAIVETGVFEQAKNGGHILSLHEYNWPHSYLGWGAPLPGRPAGLDRGVLTGRYRHLYEDFLIPRNQVIPLVITEAGYDPSVFGQGWDAGWQDRYVSEMAWYDDRMREDDYVIGCALFTLGGIAQWENWDFTEVLPELADYIVSLKDAP